MDTATGDDAGEVSALRQSVLEPTEDQTVRLTDTDVAAMLEAGAGMPNDATRLAAVYVAGIKAGMERTVLLCEEYGARGIIPVIQAAANEWSGRP